MKHIVNRAFCLILAISGALVFSSCGNGEKMNSLFEDGWTQYASGKQEEDFSVKNTGERLKKLLDSYSGSYEIPSANMIDDDDIPYYEDQRRKAMDGDNDQSSSPSDDGDIRTVNSDTELIRLFHDAYDNTDEYVSFKLGKNMSFDVNELNSMYQTLVREDPIDVRGVASWNYWVANDVYTINIIYAIDIDELKRIKKETVQLVDEAAKEFDTAGKSEYEIVKEVNDYLCDRVEYPDAEPYEEITHTAYGALRNGSAVCDGYSCAAKLILNKLSVKCDIVIGVCTNGGGHAWNLVQVDGNWYQLDITWNDGSYSRSDYFLVTDDYMKASRTWDESEYPATPTTPYGP